MDLAVAGQLVPIRPVSQLNVKGWGGVRCVLRGETTEILKIFHHGGKLYNIKQTELGVRRLCQNSLCDIRQIP